MNMYKCTVTAIYVWWCFWCPGMVIPLLQCWCAPTVPPWWFALESFRCKQKAKGRTPIACERVPLAVQGGLEMLCRGFQISSLECEKRLLLEMPLHPWGGYSAIATYCIHQHSFQICVVVTSCWGGGRGEGLNSLLKRRLLGCLVDPKGLAFSLVGFEFDSISTTANFMWEWPPSQEVGEGRAWRASWRGGCLDAWWCAGGNR